MKKTRVKLPRSKKDIQEDKQMKFLIRRFHGKESQLINIDFINTNQVCIMSFTLSEFRKFKEEINKFE